MVLSGQEALAAVEDVCSCSAGVSPSFVRNLFHESAHALHLLLSSRAPSLHSSAVYCPLDLSESPAHVLERLVYEPAVIRMISSTSQQQQLLPMLRCREVARHFSMQKRAVGLYFHAQAGLLDLWIHGPSQRECSMVQLQRLLDSQSQHLGIDGVSLQTFNYLSGLVENSGNMYAYLFAELVAAAFWKQHVEPSGFHNR